MRPAYGDVTLKQVVTGKDLGEPTEFWVLPLPSGKPYRVLRNSTSDCVRPAPFSVLPDGRHILLELQPRPGLD